ncbi:hypothetical protein E8E14_008621 [Neopestalotiopsis sp. 37M]|nr:hypothetical protein E8E14_008621 [Neopestalotiopsis sp. 37M]
MYTFWFEKPLDIREPEIWDDTTAGALEFCTHISLLSSSVKSGLDSIAIHQASGPLNEEDLGTLGYRLENLYTSPILPNGQSKPQNIDLTDEVAKEMTELDTRHLEYIVSYIEEHHAECIRPEQGSRSLKETIEKICGDKYHSAMLQLSSRHNLIVVEDVFDGKLLRHETRTDSLDTGIKVIDWLLRVDNGGGKTQFQNYNLMLAILLPAAYGGIHLAAWNAAYPSMVEHIMWRAACITIMTGIPGVAAALFSDVLFSAVLIDHSGYTGAPGLHDVITPVTGLRTTVQTDEDGGGHFSPGIIYLR